MPFAIKKLRHHAERHRLWLYFFTPDESKTVLLQTRELFLRVGRMQDEVTIDIERFIHGERQRVEVDEGPVKICARVKVSAERFQFLADLERVARGRAFFQHALGKTAGAGSGGWIGGITAIDQQREVYDRSGVALRQNNFQSVGKRCLLHGRQLE